MTLLPLLLLLLLLAPAAPHVCVHDAYSRSHEPAVKAPPSDGAGARRSAAAAFAPLRITAIYLTSAGGSDIAAEAGMTPALKAVLTTAVSAALARFSALLRVRPVSGPLFAYRRCTAQWSSNARCKAVDAAPRCSGGADDVAIPLSGMLGSQVYYPGGASSPRTLSPTGAGIASTDTAIFVTARHTSSCDSGTLAYASHCQQASDDRPTFGRINFCPGMLPPSVTDAGYEELLATALHELTHVLAFSSSLFPYYRDDAGVERTPRDTWGDPADEFYSYPLNDYIASGATISYASERGMDCAWGAAAGWVGANVPFGLTGKVPSSCVARLSTPRVRAAARAFFGCERLEGAELENQDTSAAFVQGSHWEARTLAGEYMAAYSFPGAKVSAITLAAFEDSGWYAAAYLNGDKWVKGRDWGYKQGCAFALERCSAANAGSPPHFYLGAQDTLGSLCSVDRSAPAYTDTAAYPTPLPPQYQYFADPSKGGAAARYDYCPAVTGFASPSWLCSSTTPTIAYGEVAGVGSKCHVSTLRHGSPLPATGSYGGCYRVTCAAGGQAYTLAAASGATATCASDGALATFAGYGGSVVCGDPAALCSAGEAWVPPCAAGFTLDATISACAACPAGTFGATTGLTAAACTGLCPAGRFGATPGMTAPTCTGACSAGHWCGAGSTSATQNACPPGTFSPLTAAASAAACLPCAEGLTSGPGAAGCGQGALAAATASPPTPTLTAPGTRSPSNTPLATPSSGSAVLRLSLIFAGASGGAFTAAMQGTLMASAAAALAVPPAAIGWLGGVTTGSPMDPGTARQMQALAGARVQLSLQPAAAAASPVLQASVASGSSLAAAATAALASGLSPALASHPGAAALATALGFASPAAMASSLSLDASNPIAAVVVSATPSPPSSSRHASSVLSAAEVGGLVGGILGASALALYLLSVSIVACCVQCACCCQHAACRARYRARSMWCCCCAIAPRFSDPDRKPAGMVVRSGAAV